MLAQFGQPFDSPDYLFEVKWDGVRCLAFIDHALPCRYRLVNRRRVDMTDRYPEFAFLGTLPDGTVLDGEMAVLRDGKSDFGLLASREHSRSTLKIKVMTRKIPATFIVFDLLYQNGQSLLERPLRERRELLEQLVKGADRLELILSHGIAGGGVALFRQARAARPGRAGRQAAGEPVSSRQAQRRLDQDQAQPGGLLPGHRLRALRQERLPQPDPGARARGEASLRRQGRHRVRRGHAPAAQ
jgi:hypothetical protein